MEGGGQEGGCLWIDSTGSLFLLVSVCLPV